MAGGLFLERRAEVQGARDALDELSVQALSREETGALLAQISADYQRRCPSMKLNEEVARQLDSVLKDRACR